LTKGRPTPNIPAAPATHWRHGESGPTRSAPIKTVVQYPEGRHVAVLTRVRIDQLLDYAAPPGGVATGDYVVVPLGKRYEVGVVWDDAQGDIDASRVKPISSRIAVPPMSVDLMVFLEQAAEYTVTPLTAMLGRTTRMPAANEGPRTETLYRLTGGEPRCLTKSRAKVINMLATAKDQSLSGQQILSATGVGVSVLRGLETLGIVEREDAVIEIPVDDYDLERSGTHLTDEQSRSSHNLCSEVQKQCFSVVLLKGVAGSGKTEVYLEAVRETLLQKRQVLVLLPEIALTSQFVDRVSHRFGNRPRLWHSAVAKGVKRDVWRAVAEGRVGLVVGARSALFLPFRDLGLIVIDEEHDDSYKQDEGTIYHARDMAIYRASISKSLVVLSSATPSLETWVNARSGKYQEEVLPSRFGVAGMPDLDTIDMRNEELPSSTWISEALSSEIRTRLARNEQSLLFLNRRGYAPVSVCRECGHQLGCPDCDARLVRHMLRNRMICHQCGESIAPPTVCPECRAKGSLALLGPGVERLAEEARKTFSDATIEVLSSDHIRSTEQLRESIQRIADGAVDIIIGTQLVAKGHNFPKLTLVGVIDADIGLQGGDFRAAEKTFQLVRQVAGRAGRDELPGLVLLQTWRPEHPVIQAILAGDDESFWTTEAREREIAGVPPYGQYVGILLSGRKPDIVQAYATELARRSEPIKSVGAMLYGPAPAAIFRVRGMVRYRLLLHTERSLSVQRAVKAWLAGLPPPSNVKVAIDVDPHRFL